MTKQFDAEHKLRTLHWWSSRTGHRIRLYRCAFDKTYYLHISANGRVYLVYAGDTAQEAIDKAWSR